MRRPPSAGPLTPKIIAKLKECGEQTKWARSMGFTHRRDLRQCLRAAAAGNGEAAAELDRKWPEWRALPVGNHPPDDD